MANMWTFRDGQTGELVEHDIGSATLVGFLAGNPTLGPVRRGKKETPEAKFTYGGDRPSTYTPPVVGGEADPWSPSATTENPVPEGYWMRNFDPGYKDAYGFPVTSGGTVGDLYVDQADKRAVRDKEAADARAQEIADRNAQLPPDANFFYNEKGEVEQYEQGATGWRLWGDDTPSKPGMNQFVNPGSFSTESRFGTTGYIDPETLQYFDPSYRFAASDTETAGALTALEEATKTVTLTPDAKAKVDDFLQGMSGALFDENGEPIFPELPMEVFAELLQNEMIAPVIGPILQKLIESRSNVIQNATSNRAVVEAANAQFNPFSRTAAGDRSLQEMLAGKEIERTQAQFNPFGLSTAQGVSAIQDQFNPYAQGAADRLALAQAQFDPYGQDAAARTNLISAQFNPYGFTATQGLEGIGAQYNPYGFSAPQGLEGISRQFNPYGETAADRLALSGMAQNPFGRSALQDEQLQTALARGGLSAEQRLSEIRASNNPLNTQNLLSFLGNPSAVGSAVSLGGQGFLNQLAGGQGIPQQAPQMMSPQQALPAPTPAPTGSADFSFGPMKPYDPAAPTPTSANLQGSTEEEIRFLEGSAAAQGITPSALGQKVGRVTPGGGTMGRGRI